MRHLLRIEDLLAADLTTVDVTSRRRFVVGLLFTESSLRTRVGFAVAAARLGGVALTVGEVRHSTSMAAGESLEDTARVLSGMVDVMVVRTEVELDREWVVAHAACPVVNGGDVREHPTQALIDVTAMEAMAGPIESLRVALVGDLRMRSVTSLLRYFGHRTPRDIVLCSPESRAPVGGAEGLPSGGWTPHLDEVNGADVVLMTGLPELRGTDLLAGDLRAEYAASVSFLDRQASDVVLLSPMPVIDEIGDDAKHDPRCRIYDQSDLGVGVRQAILAWCLGS